MDTFQEILDTIRSNRLRATLTGFSVAWGIYMLIVLLGSGQGLQNGIAWQFRDDAINSIWVWPGQTSMPYKGYQPGRRVQLTNDDREAVRNGIEDVDQITSRFFIPGTLRVRYREETGSFDVRSVHPAHQYVENTIMTAGRYLNDLDIRDYRKVAVIGQKVREALFKDKPAIGERIEINGVSFLVIGEFRDDGGENEMQKIYLPISTAQKAFGGGNRIGAMMMTTGQAPLPRTAAMTKELRDRLASRHEFSAEDERALNVRNNNEEFDRFLKLMSAIRAFVWVVGAGTILAGIVGVSNIMMISVRERTREIGVRKALGATPWSIVSMVLQESVLITAVAGYLGLVAGVATLETVSRFIPKDSFFINPEVNLAVGIQATVVLILAGAAAGFIPARRAAAVRPVEALRNE